MPIERARQQLLETGYLAIKVTPRARQEGIEGFNAAEELVVKTRAVPEHGRANEAVILLLSKIFSIPKSKLAIAQGEGSRHKRVAYHP